MRVAIVHDYLNQYGGAEKVVEILHEAFPDAPIYTSFYLAAHMDKAGFKVNTQIYLSWMQKLPFKEKIYKAYFLFYPPTFSRLKLPDFDVVISSSSFAAHHINPLGIHVAYIHTPPRYLYGYDTELDHAKIKKFAPFMPLIYKLMRGWDKKAFSRINFIVANSKEVQKRIKKHFGRDSTVIYPPVDTEGFRNVKREPGSYFFTWGRLVPHKRVDIIIQACNILNVPLKIAGGGLAEKSLRKLAGPKTTFLGEVSAEQLKELLSGATAFLFAADEDFGITPVEANAAGCPVIAYKGGGALETIVEGKTGLFFERQTPDSLANTIKKFKPDNFDVKIMRAQASKFSKEEFKKKIRFFVEEVYEKRKK